MIRVNNDYIIDVDPLNYTVRRDMHKTRIIKTREGETEVGTFVTVGYVSNLAGAIKCVIKDMNSRELSEGIHDLKTALEIVQNNNNRFTELLNNVTEIQEA